MCEECFGLEKRALNDKDPNCAKPDTVAQCIFCAKSVLVRPRWWHIPAVLRELRKNEMEVLSRLSVHHGDRMKHPTGHTA